MAPALGYSLSLIQAVWLGATPGPHTPSILKSHDEETTLGHRRATGFMTIKAPQVGTSDSAMVPSHADMNCSVHGDQTVELVKASPGTERDQDL